MAGSPTYTAVSSSLSCGLIVHLLLLPTPPRGDAVAVGYRPENVCLKRTFTSLTRCALRRTIVVVSPTINLCYIRHSSLKLKFGGSGRKSAG
jgi:hypothetical protein